MTKETKQRFTLRITQANPTELVVIIYEILLCYLDELQQAQEKEDKLMQQEALRNARACINELMQSLHLEYEPAGTLLQLYIYSLKRLAHFERKQEQQAIEEVRNIMTALHDAYAQLAPQNPAGPVMNNSQTVYAGFTYGRNDLTENMADQGVNRGMRI